MPLLVIAVLAIAVLLMVRAGVFSGGKGQTCRWVATGNDTVSLGEFYCKTCKVTAYARGGKPPQECKRNLRGGL